MNEFEVVWLALVSSAAGLCIIGLFLSMPQGVDDEER